MFDRGCGVYRRLRIYRARQDKCNNSVSQEKPPLNDCISNRLLARHATRRRAARMGYDSLNAKDNFEFERTARYRHK